MGKLKEFLASEFQSLGYSPFDFIPKGGRTHIYKAIDAWVKWIIVESM